MAAGHRWLEHTADLALRVWADDEPGLLEEAARALVAAVTEGGDATGPDAARDVQIDAIDPEDRLVRWLNEVLFLATVEGFLVASAELQLPSPGGLRGRVRGCVAGPEAVRAEIKSATYHALSLQHEPDGVVAHVVLDV